MATDVGDRIAKLLRLASPKSGSTEAERASAALEAAKLFGEFELQIVPVPPKRPKRFHTEPTRPSSPPPPTAHSMFGGLSVPGQPPAPQYGHHMGGADWTYAIPERNVICGVCHRPIFAGNEAWYSGFHDRFRCFDISCLE